MISKVDILAANALAQLLTVPPYAVAAVLLTLLSLVSDRLQSRGIIMAISSSLGGLGYLSVFLYSLCSNSSSSRTFNRLLLTVHANVHVRYFATFCVVSGTYTTIGITIAWCKLALFLLPAYPRHSVIVAHNLGSETKKATGIPMFMAIGQCGSILGSHLFPNTDGPRYM